MNRFVRWCFGDTDARRAVVLEALQDGPLSSYELREMYGGWIYNICHAMEREGLLSRFLGDVPIAERGNKPRVYYRRNVGLSKPGKPSMKCEECGCEIDPSKPGFGHRGPPKVCGAYTFTVSPDVIEFLKKQPKDATGKDLLRSWMKERFGIEGPSFDGEERKK